MPKPKTRLFVVTGCHTCPNVKYDRTPGAGFALDYYCTAVAPKEMIAGYVEYSSEERKPGDFPKFCPLKSR